MPFTAVRTYDTKISIKNYHTLRISKALLCTRDWGGCIMLEPRACRSFLNFTGNIFNAEFEKQVMDILQEEYKNA